MIRFRIGQQWKREAAGRPVDAFGLDLDGVDLLAGASEEPLDRVVGDLADAVSALLLRKERFAGFGLPEAHLEVVLQLQSSEISIEVVSLARPARRIRGPIRVDGRELAEAAVRCGRMLLRDLGESARTISAEARRSLSRKVEALSGAPLLLDGPIRTAEPFTYRHPAPEENGFGFEVEDREDRLRAFDPRRSGALATLLCPGKLSLVAGGTTRWQGSGVLFLMALELTRQAAELLHALELDEPTFQFAPGGVEPQLRLDLRSQVLDPRAVARACFELGEQVAVVFGGRNPAQARNPWVQTLVDRSREGAARTGSTIEPPTTQVPVVARRRRTRVERPLHATGRVRRLRFDALWDRQQVTDEAGARVLLGRKGPILSAPEVAVGFSARGDILFRHVGTHGVAVASDGYVIVAQAEQILGFPNGGGGASWRRDHDGLPLGPELIRRDGLCVMTSNGRSVVALSEVTGRELWRLVPPRTQRSHLALHGHRALLGTDGGFLFGMDLADGQVRFRMRAAMPFTSAPTSWGRKLLATLGRGDRSVLFVADAHTGTVTWTYEATLNAMSRPAVVRGRILVAGEADGEGMLVCLAGRGVVLWERPLHLGPGPFHVQALGRSVLVTAQSGAAALFSLDGLPDWRVGAAGEPLPRMIGPCHARGVLIVPGEVTRAIDPRGGRVLADVRTGVGLLDFKADPRLNLYALDEDGTLAAWRLTTALAVL